MRATLRARETHDALADTRVHARRSRSGAPSADHRVRDRRWRTDCRRCLSIKEQYARAPEPKRPVLLDGNAHAQNIFKTDQAARLTTLIVEFLDKRSKRP
jgi:hypothetical protein